MTTETFNGWANYETWNVTLWINNEYCQLQQNWQNFQDFVSFMGMCGVTQTPDGVDFNDPKINEVEVNEGCFAVG